MQKKAIKKLDLTATKGKYVEKVINTGIPKLKPFKKIWTTWRNKESDLLEIDKKSELKEKLPKPHLVTPRTRNDLSRAYMTPTYSARSYKTNRDHTIAF